MGSAGSLMNTMKLDDHFLAIWRRALNEPSLDNLSPVLIGSWATNRNLSVESVEEHDVGPFGKTRSIVLAVSGKRACFPKIATTGDAAWEERRQVADEKARLWEKMEWFSPLWVPGIKVGPLLVDTTYCSRERAIELFDYHTSTIYTLAFQAVCIAQIMPRAHSLREFCPLAREAYLAFYSGYRAASIAALIPLIEGSLAKIVSPAGAGLPITDTIDSVIDRTIECSARLHFEGMWVPREYLKTDYLFAQDERVFVFETFRRWLHRSFFRRTGEYDGQTWLNRHLFAHATSHSWQQGANFRRLVVAIATLGAIESWHDQSHQVSLLLPDMNEDSTLLWQQAIFHGQSQGILKRIEEKHFHTHGRLVPELPTDDGALLRKGILSEECINDLVRPLRDAGWRVEVAEPDELGLYMTVVATGSGEKIRAALLYSCASDNSLYRMLAEKSDVILYRGAPYRQNDYAHGLNIHVGPVSGWQPPFAPARRGSTDR
jgi:hypothetical protein